MNEHILKKAFDNYYEAPIESWKAFVDLCEEVHFKKNEKIKEGGKTVRGTHWVFLPINSNRNHGRNKVF